MRTMKRDGAPDSMKFDVRTRLRFALLRGILISLTGDRRKPKKKRKDGDMGNISFIIIPEAPSYETR